MSWHRPRAALNKRRDRYRRETQIMTRALGIRKAIGIEEFRKRHSQHSAYVSRHADIVATCTHAQAVVCRRSAYRSRCASVFTTTSLMRGMSVTNGTMPSAISTSRGETSFP